MRQLVIIALTASLLLTACGKKDESVKEVKTEYIESTPKIITANESLQMAIAGEHRSEKNRARDQFRHPLETITFLGIKPTSTVVELWPGGGWYSEVLAPYLRDEGVFYVASFGDIKEPEYRGRLHKEIQEKFAASPETYGSPIVTVLNPPTQTLLAPSGTADFVLTFRNVHNWTMNEQDNAVFKAAFQALKPNGVFGVVEHRADETMDAVAQAKTGYVSEDYVINLPKASDLNWRDVRK